MPIHPAKIIPLLLLSCLAKFTFGQISPPVPEALYPYEFTRLDTSFHGYYLTTPFKLNLNPGDPGFKTPAPLILDEEGYVVMYLPNSHNYSADFKYFPEHQKYGFLGRSGNQTIYYVLDSNFNFLDSLENSPGISPDGHELQILANGNYLIGGATTDTFDLSGDTINGIPASANTVALAYVVEEFTPAHNLVFQWSSNDYINPLEGYGQYGYDSTNYDYCHGNAICEDTDGNFLVSFRHLNAVYKIDRNSGGIIWKLGGKSSDFIFPFDAGFSGQHDIRRLPNGNITLFDNGNTHTPQNSRAIEYQLNLTNYTANRVWSYKHTPPYYGRAMGNHQTTDQRYHLVNYGLVRRPDPSFELVDDNKNLISSLSFADSVMSYRSYVLEIPLNITRPEITCHISSNGLLLVAPNGYSRYEWSTGDTTSSILLSNFGTYQVWVNQGRFMVGSEPFIYDSQTPCLSISVDDLIDPTPPEIIGIYDLLGRPVREMLPHQVYLVRYSDFSTRKVIR
ncbi:MAG: aryl-sulfate sulfotransferase [Bacteroidia bacterium]|nr:aryl-sulfate sulfotransferase [Bacteroidia bacterium]